MMIDKKSSPEPAGEVALDGVACRGARAMLGISQTELCAAANIGRNSLNEIENGVRHVSGAMLARVRVALEELGAIFERNSEGGFSVRVRQGAGAERTPRSRRYVGSR